MGSRIDRSSQASSHGGGHFCQTSSTLHDAGAERQKCRSCGMLLMVVVLLVLLATASFR